MTLTSVFTYPHLHYISHLNLDRVIPFIIIALLLEEVIPLIAIYAPFMLPSTCILPSQRERIESKRSEKAAMFSTRYYQIYHKLKQAENPSGFLLLSSLHLDTAPTAICGYVHPDDPNFHLRSLIFCSLPFVIFLMLLLF